MMDKADRVNTLVWNDPLRLSCEFVFRCPQRWQALTPTDEPTVRHCAQCNRDVHLVDSEEEFRQHAEARHCVAAMAQRGNTPDGLYLGQLGVAYGGMAINNVAGPRASSAPGISACVEEVLDDVTSYEAGSDNHGN